MTNFDPIITQQRVLASSQEQRFPHCGVIEQQWECPVLPEQEYEREIETALDRLSVTDLPSDASVAIGAGSRGIADLDAIISLLVESLSDMGYDPFVFPAMGSHGGATAQGQRKKLTTLGIDTESIGCEIRSSMSVDHVGNSAKYGMPMYVDSTAAAADAIIPVNRVKPHTDFDGSIESGICKMVAIGMGNQRGAQLAHQQAVKWSFREIIPDIVSTVKNHIPLIGGIAIVENQRHQIASVEGVPVPRLLERESELLEQAYEYLPRLPFDDIDILIVDRMGKDISGPGMDTNVIGRRELFYEPPPEQPTIKRIYVRELTPYSDGNAAGIGMADLAHQDLLTAFDPTATFINTLTGSALGEATLPPIVETDRAALTALLSSIGPTTEEDVRLVHIRDTQHLERIRVSNALLREIAGRSDVSVLRPASPLTLDGDRLPNAPT